MNAINVNPQSESALKAYAALQFPGSIDNFGTKTPIHLLMQQADSEHNLVLTDACDSDCDLDGAQFDYLGTIYDTVSELVKDRLGLKTDEDVAMFNKNNPTPFVSYEKLFGSYDVDDEDMQRIFDAHSLANEADYVDMYTPVSDVSSCEILVHLPSSAYETMGVSFTHQGIEQYRDSIDNHLFRKNYCYAMGGEGYGRDAGDFYPIMEFLRDAGEQLLVKDLEGFCVKRMSLATDEEIAEHYRSHPDESFQAAYIKVYDKHACSVYSRIYVFCSGHEEFCAEGQPHLIYENSYVIVNKAGDTYKVPYPFDGDRYIASLNKDSDETQQLNAMQRLFFWTEYKKHIEIE